MTPARAHLIAMLRARATELDRREALARAALDGAQWTHFQACRFWPAGSGLEFETPGRDEARLAVWLFRRAGLAAEPAGVRAGPFEGIVVHVVAVGGW